MNQAPSTIPSRPRPRLTAWSALSAYGHGSEPFRAGIRTRTPPFGATSSIPVPDFDPREVLGRKGTRTMDRVTGLAVATVGRLVRDEDRGARTALVLGTTTGSAQSIMDLTRASLTGDRPFDIEPATIPNSVMNCAAAQCAIRHRLEGPNATLACGHTSGLFALGYARRLLMTGRADAAILGAAEEYSPARAWLAQLSRRPASDAVLLGEGAAALRLTLDQTEPALASVLAVDSGYAAAETSAGGAVHDVVRRALERAGIEDPCEVWAALPSGLSPAERSALLDLFGTETVDRLPAPGDLLGDTGAATAAFQLATALAAAPEAPGHIVVLSCTDPDGTVAAAVLRLEHPGIPGKES
jgi:3-oxoacyl-[acyl-carrier-protein] synthase II